MNERRGRRNSSTRREINQSRGRLQRVVRRERLRTAGGQGRTGHEKDGGGCIYLLQRAGLRSCTRGEEKEGSRTAGGGLVLHQLAVLQTSRARTESRQGQRWAGCKDGVRWGSWTHRAYWSAAEGARGCVDDGPPLGLRRRRRSLRLLGKALLELLDDLPVDLRGRREEDPGRQRGCGRVEGARRDAPRGTPSPSPGAAAQRGQTCAQSRPTR